MCSRMIKMTSERKKSYSPLNKFKKILRNPHILFGLLECIRSHCEFLKDHRKWQHEQRNRKTFYTIDQHAQKENEVFDITM